MAKKQVWALVGASLAALSLGGQEVAHAQSAAQSQTAESRFAFAEQDLAAALSDFSRVTGLQVIADPALLRGKRAPELVGMFSTDAALNRLLTDANLTFEVRGATVLVRQKTAEQAAAMPSGDSEVVEEIVVTGSRIPRPELEASMPVSVIDLREAGEFGATTVYEALLRSPTLDVGIGDGNAAAQTWDAGLAAVDLRGLGVNRTLTLVDGRRRVSGSAQSSAVDLNTIPSAMIERVEILTGGATAIYGADAVTGAVNIITKKNFSGLEADLTAGVSEFGDGERVKVSLAGGGDFADGRGYILVGGTFVKNREVIALDRPYTEWGHSFYDNPENTGPTDGRPDLLWTDNYRWVAYSPYSNFLIGSAKTPYLIKDGEVVQATVDQHVNRSAGGDFPQGIGGNSDGNLRSGAQLQGPISTSAVFARMHFDITDTIQYTSNFDFTLSEYKGSMGWYRDDQRASRYMYGRGGAIAYIDNPYMPEEMRQLLVSNGLSSVPLRRTWTNFPAMRESHERESFTIDQGLNGEFANGRYQWEAYWQYGRATDNVQIANTPNIPNWVAARDAIMLNGQIVCRDATARAAGCVPYDIFAENTTQEQQRYALTTRLESRQNTQTIFGANLTGKAFTLPFGDVRFSVGAEEREDTLETFDDPRAGVSIIPPNRPNIDATQTVSEVYGELVIPILKDLPFAETLQIEGAYRYSDYQNYNTDTWKLGAVWSPVSGVVFRGVRSESVRAPNFGERFNPQNQGQASSINDPCFGSNYNLNARRAQNCAALGIESGRPQYVDPIFVLTGGNPDLRPEESSSLTIGAIFEPDFLPSFDMTVDYWSIDIEDVVTSYSLANMLRLCVDLSSIANPFCGNIERDPTTGKVTQVNSFFINAAALQANGVDLGIRYRRPVGRGEFTTSLQGTWNLEKTLDTSPGSAAGILEFAGDFTTPDFKANLYLNYEIDAFSVSLDTLYISASQVSLNWPSEEYYGSYNEIDAQIYNNLSSRYRFDGGYTLGLGVNNLFDVEPPNRPEDVWLGASGRYDSIGRYFYATFSLKL